MLTALVAVGGRAGEVDEVCPNRQGGECSGPGRFLQAHTTTRHRRENQRTATSSHTGPGLHTCDEQL
jgi:hypothetical protein